MIKKEKADYDMLLKILRLDPNYFSFLSGIFASAGINLITGVLSTDQLPSRWPFIVASAILNVFASIAWAILAWELASVERLAITEAPRFVSTEPVWEKIAITKRRRFSSLLSIAVLFAIFGIMILLLGYGKSQMPYNSPEPNLPSNAIGVQVYNDHP